MLSMKKLNWQAHCALALTFLVAVSAQSPRPSPPEVPPTLPTARASTPGKFLNFSLRASVAQGAEPVVAGVVADDRVYMLIRVVGPSLSSVGVHAPLADPVSSVYIDGREFVNIPPWGAGSEVNRSLFRRAASYVGAFPLQEDSKDLVMLFEANKGAYTVVVSAARGNGTVLLEVYMIPASFFNGE